MSLANEKRKKEREGYAEFFQHHIKIIKDTGACCEECGTKLSGHVSEVAHILPKGYFKSVATNNQNVVYMCGMYSSGQCHTNFDNFPVKKVREMLSFQKIKKIFTELEPFIEERIPYKVYERFE